MKNVKLLVNVEIELQGKFQYIQKEIRTNKLHFLLYSKDYKKAQVNYCKLVPDEDDWYYHIIEIDLEQGRRFRLGIVIEAEVMLKNYDDIESILMCHVSSIDKTFKPVQTKITNIEVHNV